MKTRYTCLESVFIYGFVVLFFSLLFVLIILFSPSTTTISTHPDFVTLLSDHPAFSLICLGSSGGLRLDALSSFLLYPLDPTAPCPPSGCPLLALDAGHIIGEQIADHLPRLLAGFDLPSARLFAPPFSASSAQPTPIGQLLRHDIGAYLLSHPHLDHTAGLVVASPEDVIGGRKPVYGLSSTLAALQRHVFNGIVWPDFGSQGLATYAWIPVDEDDHQENEVNEVNEEKENHFHYLKDELGFISIPSLQFSFRAFPLVHGSVASVPYNSTAFLVQSTRGTSPSFFLYLGDTGPDLPQNCTNLFDLWSAVAPLIAASQLRGISIECSFPNAQPDHLLFGHLNPRWLLHELSVLSSLVVQADPNRGAMLLSQLPIFVTHIKPASFIWQTSVSSSDQIIQEISQLNQNRFQFHFPLQSTRFDF